MRVSGSVAASKLAALQEEYEEKFENQQLDGERLGWVPEMVDKHPIGLNRVDVHIA